MVELKTREIAVNIEGLSESRSQAVAQYSEVLSSSNLPVIYSGVHFCKIIGVDPRYLYAVTNRPAAFYRTFSIPKSNGGRRKISEPLPLLKLVQRWILENILNKLEPSIYVKSYRKGYNLKSNSRFHTKQDFVLKIDLHNFFDHIGESHVFRIFYAAGYSTEVSSFLCHLCLADGVLCQGAPTSGSLSNLVLTNFDNRLFEYLSSLDLRYTRYSDDITISGRFSLNFEPSNLLTTVSNLAHDEGFKVNKGKSKILGRNTRQKVTGIVVNDKLSVQRSVRREFRKEIYYIERYGPRGHADRKGESVEDCLSRLVGLASHLLFVRPDDHFVREKKKKLMLARNRNRPLFVSIDSSRLF